ncbi:hypothetical protein RND81_02G017600 [Saponaria officinalis]|uniref:VOC domain-containing protein n=1 Tax=Saponaria officinalis TaxID=3572 RepID=A0AAW1MM31_SAPOF
MAEAQNNGDGAENNDGAKAVTFSAFKPELVVDFPKAVDAMAFYKAAFGAVEVSRVTESKRKADQEIPAVLAAQLKLCSSIFSLTVSADDSSLANNESAVALTLETDDIDGAVAKATTAGAVLEGLISDVQGNTRSVKLKDPYGYLWIIGSVAKAPPAAVSDNVEA